MTRITRNRPRWATLLLAPLAALSLGLAACGGGEKAEGDEHGEAEAEFERGPHNGRLLRDGDFAVEITIFETGVEPQFRVYAYEKNRPVAPQSVQLTMALTRLGGGVDRFSFQPQGDYLMGSGVVAEPHSFDVAVSATRQGKRHDWRYQSYEGRTTISREAAIAGGVKVEQAGSTEISETLDLSGRIELQPSGRGDVRAWFPGRIVSLRANVGDRVARGQIIATVESSESLQTYSIPAPISGVVLERPVNVGDVASDNPIYVIANPSAIQAEFHVFPRDAEKVRSGQRVTIRSLGGDMTVQSTIDAFLPLTEVSTQTVTARARVPNPDGFWRPGMAVEGTVATRTTAIPLAVRTSALQRFRDFTVVFARVGDTYEVRMLELGRQTPEWTEVLSGLRPGETYVTEGAFLIRADIEKSGASHDH
jgi:cobalt-zinc-cadmium efflux system membrane fusion protein